MRTHAQAPPPPTTKGHSLKGLPRWSPWGFTEARWSKLQATIHFTWKEKEKGERWLFKLSLISLMSWYKYSFVFGLDLEHWKSSSSSVVLCLAGGALWLAGNYPFWALIKRLYDVHGSRELIPRLRSYFCSAGSWRYADSHLVLALHLQVFLVSHLRDTVQKSMGFFFFLLYVLCWFVKVCLRMFDIFWVWLFPLTC